MINKIKVIVLLLALFSTPAKVLSNNKIKPCIAFSFDDGDYKDILKYKGQSWNVMITNQLKKHKVQTIWFVCGVSMDNEQGKSLLQKWDKSGYWIANHTYNHLDYSDSLITFSSYVNDIQRCDSLIKDFRNYQKIFRFPYLETGNTIEKRDSLRDYLRANDFRQGWVTIDAFDWYINSRLIERLKSNPKSDIKAYRDYYVNRTFEKANAYNKLYTGITHRQIKHTLLLHFNLTSALFLTDLIKKFKREGWQIENFSTAIQDPIYKTFPEVFPANQNLIGSLSNQYSGQENDMNFLAENADDEKTNLDKLNVSKLSIRHERTKRQIRKKGVYSLLKIR